MSAPTKRPTVVRDPRIGAGGNGTPEAKEKWFYPGRWVVQGTIFALAAIVVHKVINALTSDGDDADDAPERPSSAPDSDAA